MLSASISLSSLWLPSLWGQQKASWEKYIALSPASRIRLSYSLRYTQVQRKRCKMELRKPMSNTSEKCMCMSFHGNSGRLLAWRILGHLHGLRSDCLRSLTVTSAICSLLLYHHFPMSFLRSLKFISPYFRASPLLWPLYQGGRSWCCLPCPATCGHSWHGPSKGGRSCILGPGEVEMCLCIKLTSF